MSLLTVSNLSRDFGGVHALKGVSLDVAEGDLLALIGPNGAGKTTLFSIISGFLRPSEGTVCFAGREIAGLPPHAVSRMGLVRTFQITRPFAALSVRDNITVGALRRAASRAEAQNIADAVADELGLAARLWVPAAQLTVVERKRLEVARALATGPRLLLLDEVFAGLNPAEVGEMLPMIMRLRERGVTILLTEHVLQAVRQLADRAVVLNNGEVIAQGTLETVFDDPAVLAAYLGKAGAEPVQGAGADA